MGQKRLGIKQVSLDGVVLDAKGDWSYSLGGEKREPVLGQDRMHGVKITRLVAFVEGMVTDGRDIDLKKLMASLDSTVTVDLQSGKTIKLGHAYYAAEGKVTASEGEIEFRFEADPDNAEEI